MIETFIYKTPLDSCMNYSWYDIHLLVVYDQWSYAKPSWMNLAIIELWSLINEAFYTSCHRKTDQITDHFWKGRGFQYCAGLFIIFINCYNMNIVQFILWHSITRKRVIDQWWSLNSFMTQKFMVSYDGRLEWKLW